MIIYIAGPMTGYVDLNYPEFFRAERELLKRGHDVLNPARVDQKFPSPCADWDEPPPHALCPHCEARTWGWYLRKCLAMLVEADGVALLTGWEGSTGARVEHSVANALGMRVLMLDTWLLAEPACGT